MFYQIFSRNYNIFSVVSSSYKLHNEGTGIVDVVAIELPTQIMPNYFPVQIPR